MNSITPANTTHRCQRGFTLIELMMVVAIIAILAAIGYPSYQQYTTKARRADAKAVLLELAQVMERNFTVTGRYDKDSSNADVDTDWLPFTTVPKTGGRVFYNVTVATGRSTFTMTATPTAAQNDPLCQALTINQAGVKTENGNGSVADCW